MALRSLEELDAAHAGIDGTASALAATYDSGRAPRLLLKLAFVNERPEFGIDQRWSESGYCYILKLFRDYGECKRVRFPIDRSKVSRDNKLGRICILCCLSVV